MSRQEILSGSGVLWDPEKTKLNSNFIELYGFVSLWPIMVEQAADPATEEHAAGTWIFATGSGNVFYQSSTGLFSVGGTYEAN